MLNTRKALIINGKRFFECRFGLLILCPRNIDICQNTKAFSHTGMRLAQRLLSNAQATCSVPFGLGICLSTKLDFCQRFQAGGDIWMFFTKSLFADDKSL